MSFSCQPRKGNITVVVLLLMIASGLLAILTLQFVKYFIINSSVLDQYYKAYYMARGGLETMLTEANMRGYGFQYDMSQTPTLVRNYYTDCKGLGVCDLQGSIISRGETTHNSPQGLFVRSCPQNAMISVKPGESVAYPLFYDKGVAGGISFLDVQPADYEKNPHNGYNLVLSGGTLQAYLYDAGQGFGQITATQPIVPPSVSNLFATQSIVQTHRIILYNPSNSPLAAAYCLESDATAQKLVGNFTKITAQATYQDKTVGLTALKKFVFPSVLIQ